MDAVTDKILNTMAQIFEVDRSVVNESTSMDSLEVWDSLKHMNLVISLEETFGIQFTDQEIVELLNYKLIDSTIRSKLKQDLRTQ